jgi:hypothetical protein
MFDRTAIGLFPPAPTYTFKDIPDLSGKVAIVTGANTGIGQVTARELLRNGAKVYVACRSEEKANAAIEQMKKETGKSDAQSVSSSCCIPHDTDYELFGARPGKRQDQYPSCGAIPAAGKQAGYLGQQCWGHGASGWKHDQRRLRDAVGYQCLGSAGVYNNTVSSTH